MNNNQIAKGLLRAGKSYINSQKYEQLIRNAKLVRLSFKELTNLSAAQSSYNKIITSSTVSLPFNNMLFDIVDYPITSMATGNISNENFAIHLQPVIVELHGHKLITMVVTDIRLDHKLMMSRSYVIYADKAGIHVMTAVDKASSGTGCNCFKQNVFSADPTHALAFQDILPCFSMDVGLALPDCSGTKAGCAPVVACKQEMAGLIKVLLAYANLPSNFFVKVVSTRAKNRREQYHIICDITQWEQLRAGNEAAELSGNAFTDGSKLLTAMEMPLFAPPTDTLVVGNKTYTALARDNDETGPSSKDSEESDVGSRAPMAPNLPENAS